MASTQKKTTPAKKSTASKGTRAASSKSGSKSSSGSSRAKKPAQPQKKPIRREVGAVVCLLLAFFGAIGYFAAEKGAAGENADKFVGIPAAGLVDKCF